MDRIHFIQPHSSLTFLPQPHYLYKIDASLNPYSGCPNHCMYCPYSYPKKVGLKTDFIHYLSEKLRNEKRSLHLGLGTCCEVYSEVEDRFTVVRHIIELVIKHGLPLQVFTKSGLVLRDSALLSEYSQKGLAAVSISLNTLNKKLAHIMEPGLPSPQERLQLLRILRKKGVFAGIVLAPLIPYVTDAQEDLHELFSEVKKAGGEYILPAVLAVHSAETYDRMKSVISREYPRISHRFEGLYEKNSMPSVSSYVKRMNDLLDCLSTAHRIPLSIPRLVGDDERPDLKHDLLEYK